MHTHIMGNDSSALVYFNGPIIFGDFVNFNFKIYKIAKNDGPTKVYECHNCMFKMRHNGLNQFVS